MLRLLREIGRISYFAGDIFRWLFIAVPSGKLFLEEVYRIGIRSLPIVGAVAFFIGSNIAIQGYGLFKEFGGESMVGMFVGLATIREMAPIVAGAMVAAKSGSEIAASIATMRVKQQIDAMEVMAVNPFWYLMVPKFLAAIVVVPLLVLVADFFTLASGYVVSVYQLKVNSGVFMLNLARFVTPRDIMFSMIKGLVFGVVVCILSCYYGYHSKPGARGVGTATNRSIVSISALSIIINYFLSELMYG
jgi:phospholipid/cholesterol/gamma-HCH transport system permease protein